MRIGRREPCTKCGMPVFIAERMLVGGRLYHRTCFRCARCQTQLSVANCYETEGGEYCCETCPDEVLADKENHPTKNELDMIGHAGPEDQYSAEFESAMEDSIVSQNKQLTPKFSKAQSDFMSSQLASASSRNSLHSDSEEKGPAVFFQLRRTNFSSSLPLRSTESPVKDLNTGSSKNVNKLVEGSPVVSRPSSREGGVSELTKYFSRNSDNSQAVQSSECSGNDSKKDVPISVTSKIVNTSEDKLLTANSTSSVNSQDASTKDSDSDELPAANIVKSRMKMFEKSTSADDKEIETQSNKRFSLNQRNSSTQDETKHISVAALKDLMQKDDSISKDEQGKPVDKIAIISGKSEVDQENLFKGIYKDSIKTESQLNFDNLSAEDKIIEKDTLGVDKSDTPKAVSPIARPLESEIPSSSSSEIVGKSDQVLYPKDLNPFGDDEDEDTSPKPRELRPSTGLNPFGSSDEEDTKPIPVARKNKQRVIEAPKVNLNPFWSDGEEPSSEDEMSSRKTSTGDKPPIPKPRTVIGVSPQPSPRPRKSMMNNSTDKFGSVSSLSSLNSSTGGTTQRKKKPAPTPPRVQDVFLGVPGTPTVHSANSSRASSPTPSSGHSPKTPRHRKKSRPPPPPPPPTSLTFAEAKMIVSDPEWEGEKNKKDVDNRNRQSQALSSLSPESPSDHQLCAGPNKSIYGQWKRKKGPAPPRPVPQRRQIKAIPMKEVKRELDDIEVKQQELERQGVTLEKTIREKFEQQPNSDNSSMTPDVEDLVLQLFELVNEKNELFRRQAELMYLELSESEASSMQCSISDYRSFCKSRRPTPKPALSAYLRIKSEQLQTVFKKHHP